MEEYEGFHVGELTWRALDIGYGVDEGFDTGYWTDERGGLGRSRQFVIVDGNAKPLYLFPDEVLEWNPL